MPNKNQKAYVITVDMGYGHQRAAYPLKCLAANRQIINANTYAGIPAKDKDVWKQSREAYEFISRFKKIPLLGGLAFDLFDKFQSIPEFYPKRDLSKPSLQLESIVTLIKKKNWGKNLIDKLAKKPLPIVSTFFIPAFMAEIFNYPGEIYCLATDTDVSRAWAPIHPHVSKIKYFAPSYRVEERLKLYGIIPENIFVTGFPLPEELVGDENKKTLKHNLGHRLFNLDPQKKYIGAYHETISHLLGSENKPKKKSHILTLSFLVGGAGAQRELGIEIVKSLKEKIEKSKIRVILVAGTHHDVNTYFKREVINLGLRNQLGKNIEIIFAQKKEDYFKEFNKSLATTDIIWTKPSEMSFYVALGIPIIMSPPVGSQEDFNRRWLRTIGAGVNQENPKYTHQWLFDWLDSGWFAEAAMQGFIEASTSGVSNIRKVLAHKPGETYQLKKILQY